jgi:hypothetical protein
MCWNVSLGGHGYLGRFGVVARTKKELASIHGSAASVWTILLPDHSQLAIKAQWLLRGYS